MRLDKRFQALRVGESRNVKVSGQSQACIDQIRNNRIEQMKTS